MGNLNWPAASHSLNLTSTTTLGSTQQIEPLGHDPLQAVLLRRFEEGYAFSLDRLRDVDPAASSQSFAQQRPAPVERFAQQRASAQVEKVVDDVGHRMHPDGALDTGRPLRVLALLQCAEVRAAGLVRDDQLAINDGLQRQQLLQQLSFRILAGEGAARAF